MLTQNPDRASIIYEINIQIVFFTILTHNPDRAVFTISSPKAHETEELCSYIMSSVNRYVTLSCQNSLD